MYVHLFFAMIFDGVYDVTMKRFISENRKG